MARCNNNLVLQKIGQKKLDSLQEIDFSVRRRLRDCRRIRADKVVGSTKPTFSTTTRPKNRFECNADGCTTTGTATINTSALYYLATDATEISSGIVTFYAKAASYPVTLTVTISDEEALTNADVYTVQLLAADVTDDGFIPVMIDLSKAPDSTAGNGWTASVSGLYMQISGSAAFDLSSISFHESILDFETNATVKMGCITSAGGSYDLSVIEQTCRQAELDDSISQLSFPITCRLMTPNYYLLSPMYQKGTETEGFRPITVEKEVQSTTKGGGTYGYVHLADAHPTECRFWGVQLSDTCDPYEAQLEELTLPVFAGIPEKHFQVTRNADGVNVYFDASMIGKKVLIEYPQIADIEEFIFGTDDLNEVVTSMTVPYCFAGSGTTGVTNNLHGGVNELHVYDHVLVTGFPFGISNSDQDVSFTITVMKVDGKFFRVQRYV